MPMAERLKRKIVPRKGFCSLMPGRTTSEGITSGNGPMNLEITGDPYSEQILFRHESLLMPWKRPFEAPKVSDIFPQVRQMVLDGKYQEAIEFAFKEMEKGPIKANTWPHPTVPAFLMPIDLPKTRSATNYLRTVNFEPAKRMSIGATRAETGFAGLLRPGPTTSWSKCSALPRGDR